MTRAIFLLCVLCVSPLACSAPSECDANAGECDAKDQNVLLQGRVRVEPEKSQLKAEAAGNAEEGIVGEEEGQPDDNEEDDEDEEGEALLEEDDDEEDDEKDVDHAVSGDKKAARRACRKACRTEMRSKRPAVKKECKAKAGSRQARRQCIRGEMSKLRKACKAKCSSFLDESDEMAEMEDPVRGYLMVVNNSCHSSGNIRVSSASQCAAKAYSQCATKDYMQSKNGRYCYCCRKGGNRYFSTYYNLYRAYKGTPPATTTTTTTTPDAANAPHGLVVSKGFTCGRTYKHFNGGNINSDFCAMMTLATPGCGKEFQYAAAHPHYGCACCRPGGASGGYLSPVYDIYLSYKGAVPPSTTTTTTITPSPEDRTHGLLIAKGRYCQRTFKHFRVTNEELCAKFTLNTRGCAKEFARYPTQPTWGCACCSPSQALPGTLNTQANIYIAYKGTTPPSTTTTTTTTPDAANAPHGMIVARNITCKRTYKYFPVQNPDTCAGLVLATPACAKEFSFSAWNPGWGCRCCQKGNSYGGYPSSYYQLYLAYKGTTPPSTTTTTTTTPDAANAPHGHLKKGQSTCYNQYKHFPWARNTDTCAMLTLMEPKCAKEFHFSPKYTAWGCACCLYSNTRYRSNSYYNVYTAYKGTCVPGSPCDTTTAAPATTTTTPAPCAHGQQWRFGSLGQSCDTVCGRSACDLASIRNIAYDKKKFKAVAEKLGFWSAASSWGHSSGWDEFPGTLDWMHGRKFGYYNDTYKTTTCEASHIKVRRLCSCCTEATSTSTAAPTPAPTTPAPTTPAPTTPAPTTPAPSPATTPAPMPAPAPAPAPPVPAPAQPVPTPDPRVDELAKSVDSVQKDLGIVKSDVKKILESFEGDGDGDGDGPPVSS